MSRTERRQRIRTSFRAFHYFGDILPMSAFEYPVVKKKELNEVCDILERECGIKGKRLAMNGEGEVTE